MLHNIPRLLWQSAFIVCLLAILVLALVENPPAALSTGWDKSNHALAFTVLILLGRLSFPANHLPLLAGLLAYGLLIEALQAMTTYRFAEYGDVIADMVGMTLGYLLAMPLVKAATKPR